MHHVLLFVYLPSDQSWSSPYMLLYFRGPAPENYISHAPPLRGLQLGSASGRHWPETGGRGVGSSRWRGSGISPSLSLSVSGSVLAVPGSSWLQLPRPRSTMVLASTKWPQLRGSSNPTDHRPRDGGGSLQLLNLELPPFFSRLLFHHFQHPRN